MESSCPICFDDYNPTTNLPRILPMCGHTLCSYCITNIIKDQATSKCPFDKAKLPREYGIEQFPVNYALRKIIETKLQTDNCREHGEELAIYCFTDHFKICNMCLEDHHGHHIRALKSVKKQADGHRKQVRTLSEKVRESHEEVHRMIEKQRKIQNAKIETDYLEALEVLNFKRQCLRSQANLMFDMEKIRVESLLGETSMLSQDLIERDIGLENVLSQEELFKYHEVPVAIQGLTEKYELIVSSETRKDKVEEDLKQINQCFENAFLRPKLVLAQVEVKLDRLLTMSKIQSHLIFDYKDTRLVVKNVYLKPKEAEIDLKTWLEAKEVAFIFNRDVYERDLGLLACIWNNLKDPSSLKLKFTAGMFINELYYMFSNNPYKFKSIEIDISDYELDEESLLIPLLRDIFLKAKNIEVINLIMKDMEITDGCLQKIFEGGIFDTTNLTEFHLNLFETSVKDKDLKDIFVEMPKLRKLKLVLNGTKVTDETLISCAQNILTSTQALEDLTIDVFDTKVTDTGVENLCRNLVDVKIWRLSLEFGGTQVTDKTCRLLKETMFSLELFNTLEAFGLGLSRTKVSHKSLNQLFRPMPNVKDLHLGLRETLVSNKTIQRFIENTLVSVKALDSVEILLGDTKITDKCFGLLLRSLKDAKKYTLGFENTTITDKTLEAFLEQKLSLKSICEELDIDVFGTKISAGLGKKINKFSEIKSRKSSLVLHM